MKNLPGIISLFAIASLAVLVVASVFGVSCPYASLAWRIVGFSWATGVFAIFVTDYAPRHSYGVSAEAKSEDVPAVQTTVTAEAMATLGLANDPATVTMS